MKKFNELAEQVTNEIIAELKNGNVIWTKPWTSSGARNYVTGRVYEGFNQLYLSYKCIKKGYSSPCFLSYNQAVALGGHVKKGERGIPVIYWKITNRSTGKKVTDQDGNEMDVNRRSFYPFLHYVFNIAQVEGVDFKSAEIAPGAENSPIEICERIVEDMPLKPAIYHNDGDAYYVPSLDYVNMPELKMFKSSAAYYSVLFHELVHSTGHTKRLNRFKEGERPARFGDEEYSKEELVAEMGAAILTARAGITNEFTKKNTIAYINSWIKALEDDKTLLITAANKAFKAAAFILAESECAQEAMPSEPGGVAA